jgi:hypothetical protein
MSETEKPAEPTPVAEDADKKPGEPEKPPFVAHSPVGGVLVQTDPPAEPGLSTPETRAQHPDETAKAAAAARAAAADPANLPSAHEKALHPEPAPDHPGHEPPHAA